MYKWSPLLLILCMSKSQQKLLLCIKDLAGESIIKEQCEEAVNEMREAGRAPRKESTWWKTMTIPRPKELAAFAWLWTPAMGGTMELELWP